MNEFTHPIEFDEQLHPTARRGLTTIEAVQFLRSQFPQVSRWTAWSPWYDTAKRLVVLPGTGVERTATWSGWTSRRIEIAYPETIYWSGSVDGDVSPNVWVGAVELTPPNGRPFLLFSYLDSEGGIGGRYLASTTDLAQLAELERALRGHFDPDHSQRIHVLVSGGRGFSIPKQNGQPLFLHRDLLQDIEQQAESFFARPELYQQLGLRYRRGFLFVGQPGTGKTMMTRHLIRRCHERYQVAVLTINITKHTEEGEVGRLFRMAARRAPSIVVLEDVDSLTQDCRHARAALLAQLDGLSSDQGFLLIATTNNPEKIDPALAHRPSRFDRVWKFKLPDAPLRQQYLDWACPQVDPDTRQVVAARTDGWSFAYLNELRASAGVLAANQGQASISGAELQKAFQLLQSQFRAGAKRNAIDDAPTLAGFRGN